MVRRMRPSMGMRTRTSVFGQTVAASAAAQNNNTHEESAFGASSPSTDFYRLHPHSDRAMNGDDFLYSNRSSQLYTTSGAVAEEAEAEDPNGYHFQENHGPPPPLLRVQESTGTFQTNFTGNRNSTTVTNASSNNNTATVEDFQMLLDEGIDINATAEDGNTPLAVAAFHGDFAVCQFLVQNGADPNLATVQGAPPLYWAASNGHSSVIKLLIENGADPNNEARDGLTPLICAAVGAHAECCRLLLEMGALPNLEHKDTQETALYGAAQEGHVVCLTWLLEKGADPDKANRVGETPLFWACRNGHATCVQRLLEFGAHPDLSTWDKQTPLYWACVNQNLECARLLLEEGEADPNIATKQKTSVTTTPLEAAVWNNDKEVVNLLLKWGAQEDLHRAGFVSKWMDKTACPDFVLTLLDMDLSWDSKQLLLENSLKYLKHEQVLLKILTSRLGDLSQQSSDRRTIFLLMFDFYVYLIWIYGFAAATFQNLPLTERETTVGSLSVNLGLTAYVFLRELLAIRQQGKSYFQDMWNWIDLAAIALVTTANIKWIMGHILITGNPMFQNIVISGGALVMLSFVGYLKATFLPFSNFVGGVSQIMWDLLPFAIVTCIVILVFAFMFFIQEYESEGYEDFYSSFLTVFSYFVGDPRIAEGPLDLIFGVVVVVVLLNVVIAIVSASWENAVNTSLILLCTHRLQLLRRANDNFAYLPKWFEGEWWIDKEFDLLMDRCLDEVREEYEFWVGFNRWHPTAFLWSVLYLLMFLVRPFMTFLMWIMGAATFGLLWTLHVRMYLFGINPAKDTLYIRMERMETVTQNLSSVTKQIHDDVTTYHEKQSDTSPNRAHEEEITLLHEKIDNIRELFLRTTRTSQSRSATDGSSGGGTTATTASPPANDSNNDPSNNSIMTMGQMEQEMQILHTKVDLVLEYVMSQSAAERVRRRSSAYTTNPNNYRRSYASIPPPGSPRPMMRPVTAGNGSNRESAGRGPDRGGSRPDDFPNWYHQHQQHQPNGNNRS